MQFKRFIWFYYLNVNLVRMWILTKSWNELFSDENICFNDSFATSAVWNSDWMRVKIEQYTKLYKTKKISIDWYTNFFDMYTQATIKTARISRQKKINKWMNEIQQNSTKFTKIASYTKCMFCIQDFCLIVTKTRDNNKNEIDLDSEYRSF